MDDHNEIIITTIRVRLSRFPSDIFNRKKKPSPMSPVARANVRAILSAPHSCIRIITYETHVYVTQVCGCDDSDDTNICCERPETAWHGGNTDDAKRRGQIEYT